MWRIYIGLSTDATSIRSLVRRFYEFYGGHPPFNPFERVIVSPLFVQPAVLKLLACWREGLSPIGLPVQRVSSIIFDSGGYQVQTGKLTFEELCSRLKEVYRQHTFADFYVLPDFPPLSSDSDADVARKITATLRASEKLLVEIGDATKAIGVVHARYPSQVRYAVTEYHKLGIRYLGFGSFGTSGKNLSVNLLSYRSIALLKTLQSEALSRSMSFHIFGIGNPNCLLRLALAGINPASVDTSAWSKAGGFGSVFIPLFKQAHISQRVAKGWRLTDIETFTRLCELAGHSCPFCREPTELQRSRWARILHNLTVTIETAMALQRGG